MMTPDPAEVTQDVIAGVSCAPARGPWSLGGRTARRRADTGTATEVWSWN